MNASQVVPASAEQVPAVIVTGASTVLQVIERAARDPSVDIDKMRSLLQMHQEIRARDAETAFNAAMKEVQGELGPVGRDKANEHTRSRYARLETIIAALNPISTKHGFSMSFGTDDSPLEGHYRVTCDVLHDAGHKRHYFADVPSDLAGSQGKANKTGIQAFGSAMTYARRYLTTMIFNIAIADEDDDGNAAGGNASPQKRTRVEISAEADRKRRDLRSVTDDILQLDSLAQLERYEREELTPDFMSSLGMKQYAVEQALETRRIELKKDVEAEGPSKADYIRQCHEEIDAFESADDLLVWWNSDAEKHARRNYALNKDEVQELIARVFERREALQGGSPDAGQSDTAEPEERASEAPSEPDTHPIGGVQESEDWRAEMLKIFAEPKITARAIDRFEAERVLPLDPAKNKQSGIWPGDFGDVVKAIEAARKRVSRA